MRTLPEPARPALRRMRREPGFVARATLIIALGVAVALTGHFAFFEYGSDNLVGDGAPERLVGVGVADNCLPVLGVRPLLGRDFTAEESVWNGRAAGVGDGPGGGAPRDMNGGVGRRRDQGGAAHAFV